MSEASQVVGRLRELALPAELPKVRKRLSADEPAFGLRMRDVFDTAKAHVGLGLDQVHELLDHPAYEPRLTAFCILDFKARRRLDPRGRRELCEIYVERHDRITTWDMVDRSAPRVVGGCVSGGPYDLLFSLAEADAPLQRRSAVTAPLLFTRSGGEADLDAGFAVAERLLADPLPVVHNAVGTFLKHAGGCDPDRLRRLLSAHAADMTRACLRLATEKLDPAERSRYREG
ncbi:DNA alkylation repair protein [Brevibacterium album]|uniref:DNA alkylation repair protein n=1 Tax=Brevibacterium album TaxID=417948 RepID=UPI00048C4223|nr:DNA alkylation repair protein [Brevibacterium album]